jgi:4-azaleucine resistance transporter AzlC
MAGTVPTKEDILSAFHAALPVMLGYLAIGLPCGIMESKVGFSPLMSFLLSMTFYSGAGQFMIPSMWLAGAPLYSVIASVSFVNTRQMLYSAAFSPYFSKVGRPLAFFFSATVTDESFGVSLDRFVTDKAWTPRRALLVNLMCMASWSVANAVGTAAGPMLDLPVAVTSFAMTSIFVCLLVGQPLNRTTAIVIGVAFAGVLACKLVGLSGPAILLGALAGVFAGMAYEVAIGR